MFKKVGACVFFAVVTMASINVAAADVKAMATKQNIKLVLNDLITLQYAQEISRTKTVSRELQSPEEQLGLVYNTIQKKPERQNILASIWVLGVALSLFVLRTSRRKV